MPAVIFWQVKSAKGFAFEDVIAYQTPKTPCARRANPPKPHEEK
ncbi:MAG: hypothetical protein ACJAVM_000831 [Sulfitobacter sp.]|jgi:hypothetical protein